MNYYLGDTPMGVGVWDGPAYMGTLVGGIRRG